MERASQISVRYSDNTAPRNTCSIISATKSSPYIYYPEVALEVGEVLGENVNPNVSYYVSEINDPDTHDRENVIFVKNSNNPEETMVLGKLKNLDYYTLSEIEDELMKHLGDTTGNQLTDLEKQTILKAYKSGADYACSVIGIEAKDSSREKCFLIPSEDDFSVGLYTIDSSEVNEEVITQKSKSRISDKSSKICPDISKKVGLAITESTMPSEIMESAIESSSQIYEVEIAIVKSKSENRSSVEETKDTKTSSWSFLDSLFNLFGFIKISVTHLVPMFFSDGF